MCIQQSNIFTCMWLLVEACMSDDSPQKNVKITHLVQLNTSGNKVAISRWNSTFFMFKRTKILRARRRKPQSRQNFYVNVRFYVYKNKTKTLHAWDVKPHPRQITARGNWTGNCAYTNYQLTSIYSLTLYCFPAALVEKSVRKNTHFKSTVGSVIRADSKPT